MEVYVANFGEKNYEWPTCLERSTIATMNEKEAQPFWEAGDRDGYIEERLKFKTAAGKKPTKALASRWFNLMSIIDNSDGDLWIHSDTKFLWWTISRDQPSTFIEKTEPVGRKRDVIICHKPCDPWQNRSSSGQILAWNALHPKAKDFLSTESTLQKLSEKYRDYAIALVFGEDLSPWHSQSVWTKKLSQSKRGSGRVFSRTEIAAYRMAEIAFNTAQNANGQTVDRRMKVKEFKFGDKNELMEFLIELLQQQDHACALSGLNFNLSETEGDKELRPSLDRIDSDGHYERDNLQIVCRFINRWKGADDNSEFSRLLGLLAAIN